MHADVSGTPQGATGFNKPIMSGPQWVEFGLCHPVQEPTSQGGDERKTRPEILPILSAAAGLAQPFIPASASASHSRKCGSFSRVAA